MIAPSSSRWVPTGKIFTSSTTTVDSEPPHGSNTDITNLHECIQTLYSSAGTSKNVQEEQNLDFSIGKPFNLKKERIKACIQENVISGRPSEDLGILQAKADIGIFIGYVPKKKAYHIYNLHTRKIIETIHVDFDETAMAYKQLSSGPGLQCMTPATSSLGLIPNTIPQQPCIPPPRDD
ncbi:hypothetical protein Tco_0775653 [Tanacetum coccineum]